MAGDRIQSMMVFKRVAELGSFSQAAVDLNITAATVSKHIAFLERHIGVRLIHRTTRSMNLTETGSRYLERVQHLLDSLEEAEQEAAGSHMRPKGRIRINAPMSFGLMHLPSIVDSFLKHYPETDIDLQLNDHAIDLVEQGVDIALRMREQLDDSSLIAHPVITTRSVLCASPVYIHSAPALKKPDDLSQHNCIAYSLHRKPNEWQLGNQFVCIKGNYRTDNSLMIEQSLINGMGIGLIPRLLIEKNLANGKLIELLPDYPGKHYTLFAILPPGRQRPFKVQLFLDHLKKHLEK